MKTPYFKYALGQLMHWLGASRHPDSWVARFALLLLGGLLGSWLIMGMQNAVTWGLATLLLGVLILLTTSRLQQIRRDFRDDIEHQVLVIGVGDTAGLMQAVPAHIRGQRTSYELRQPLPALRHLAIVEERVNEALHCQPPAGIKVVYAGRAPSPIAFLMGFYLGYTRVDAIMESTPHRHAWQLLDALDDGARFETRGLEQLKPGMLEATILIGYGDAAISVSDACVSPELQQPLISMMLAGSAESCLSASKQTCLANQFDAVLQVLADHGVQTVHLRYVGPHSLLFNLGRHYRRLHALALIVYPHDTGLVDAVLADSWALRMPGNAHAPAEMISLNEIEQAQDWISPLAYQQASQARSLRS